MLRMLLNRILLKRNSGLDNSLAEMRAAFAIRYRDIVNSCQELNSVVDLPPNQLARRYMSSVLSKQTDAAWWQENSVYLTETWFIYEYSCENELIRPMDRPTEVTVYLFPIKPEPIVHEGLVRISLERTVGAASCGNIFLEYSYADDVFRDLVRMMKFACKEERCVRAIDEMSGCICDRAVEVAVNLLQHGYQVCVEEPLLRDRILAEEYEPEHLYWISEGSELDKLELRYPKDKQLHEYVYKAGGRWNGKTVEISICNAHLLDDVIRLYGFRMTKDAKMRMDAWRETLEQATIYRARKRKDTQNEMQMVDRFKEMMDRKQQRIDDLYENDE